MTQHTIVINVPDDADAAAVERAVAAMLAREFDASVAEYHRERMIEPAEPLTRDEAITILIGREGIGSEHVESLPDEPIIAAAEAPEGIPCADCGALVRWDESVQDWRHPSPTGCFLARRDER